MDSLLPFLWGSFIPYNMPVYPGALRIARDSGDTTVTSTPASSMNEMVAPLDHRSGASPPMGACALSVSCQKKSGSI